MNFQGQGIVVASGRTKVILLHIRDHRDQLIIHLHKPRWKRRHCSECGDLLFNPCLRTNLALQNISWWTLAGPLGDMAGPWWFYKIVRICIVPKAIMTQNISNVIYIISWRPDVISEVREHCSLS